MAMLLVNCCRKIVSFFRPGEWVRKTVDTISRLLRMLRIVYGNRFNYYANARNNLATDSEEADKMEDFLLKEEPIIDYEDPVEQNEKKSLLFIDRMLDSLPPRSHLGNLERIRQTIHYLGGDRNTILSASLVSLTTSRRTCRMGMSDCRTKTEVLLLDNTLRFAGFSIEDDCSPDDKGVQREIVRIAKEERAKGNDVMIGLRKLRINGKWFTFEELQNSQQDKNEN